MKLSEALAQRREITRAHSRLITSRREIVIAAIGPIKAALRDHDSMQDLGVSDLPHDEFACRVSVTGEYGPVTAEVRSSNPQIISVKRAAWDVPKDCKSVTEAVQHIAALMLEARPK